MPAGHGTHRRSRFLLLRVVRARPRLFFCGALGVVVVLALTALTGWRLSTRLLLGWNIAVGLYMVLVFDLMAHSDTRQIRLRAAKEDEGQFALLVLTVAAALMSLAAIFAELRGSPGTGQSPFVLTVENAAAYFGPSTVIRDIYKQSPTMLLRLPGIKRSLADILQAHTDRRYLLAATAAPTGDSTGPSR